MVGRAGRLAMTAALGNHRWGWFCLAAAIVSFPATYGVMFLISGPDPFLLAAGLVVWVPLAIILLTIVIYLFASAPRTGAGRHNK